IFLLNNTTEFNTPVDLLFFDDRGDDLLNQFQLFSGASSTLYTISLNSNSYINVGEITVGLNNPSTLFSNKSVKHTATDNSANVSGNYFVHIFSDIYFLSTTMQSDSLGSYGLYKTSGLKLKRGSLNSVSMDILSGTISGSVSSSSKNFTFSLNLQNVIFQKSLNCLNNVSIQNPGYLQLQWKFSDLFKDNSSGYIISGLDSKVSNSGNIIISSTTNQDIYNILLANISANASIFLEYKCLQ
ncbi:MAG: hypothetical protein KDK36_18465, partial [Leptospiraceae bacterium]|nr:hypothetical protein [Leptospiraceae bacterium]